jgi:DNA-binding CsgD family transcriptional regulator/tetratricopeptide (TPR) repeat protein
MRCPVLVGRGGERRLLLEAFDAASRGSGGLVVVTGEAGVGKSRLAAELAQQVRNRQAPVLSGRASVGGGPYRALAEALLKWSRRSDQLSRDQQLAPFRPALARILPVDPAPTAGDQPLAVLAEGILRLLGVLGSSAGCLLILEDLHWADAETLAVIDYLSDGLADVGALCVVTMRNGDGSPSAELARSWALRDAATVVALGRLDRIDIADLARGCLGSDRLSEELTSYLYDVSEGLPLVTEELLAALVERGELTRTAAGWRAVEPLTAEAPNSLVATVNQRMAVLSPRAAEVVRAGAVIGRRFPSWPVATMTALDHATVLAALSAGVELQLLEPTDEPRWFRFRHALTRDAVLQALLPAEAARLASQAAQAIQDDQPGLSGDWASLAAGLWATADEPVRASDLYLEAARRALALGALASAESYLRRSADLDPQSRRVIERDDLLLDVLSLAGRVDEALAVGVRLLSHIDETNAEGIATTRLRLARAALAADRATLAREHLEAVREQGHLDSATHARVDALAGLVALSRGQTWEAEGLARRSFEAALRSGLPEIGCEALEVLGRAARTHDLSAAEEAFVAAERLAGESRLTVWQIRALHELGTIDFFDRADPTRLVAARDLAVAHGVLATAANIELHIAACHASRAETGWGLAASRRCEQLARRCRLDTLVALSLGFQGNVWAQLDRPAEMEQAAAAAMTLAGHDPQIQATVLGSCRGHAALVDDDLDRALVHLGAAVRLLLAAGQSTPAPGWGAWCLLAAVVDRDDLGASRLPGPRVHRMVRGLIRYGDAVRAGRLGQHEQAAIAFADGDADLAHLDWWRHLGRRWVAEAALGDGWGQPALWAREGYQFFSDGNYRRLAGACRRILVTAGEPLPRRGRGSTEVPPRLRALRVTSREMDVLALVGQHLTNPAIAERLVLSRRTVEGHISRLLAKCGADDRAGLICVAEACQRDKARGDPSSGRPAPDR